MGDAGRLRLNPGIIYVDGRVGSAELAPILNERYACRVTTEFQLPGGRRNQLPAADFAFTCGHTERNPLCSAGTLDGDDFGCVIGIERKTIGDLVGSLLKNRLGGGQIPDMLRLYDYVWILVEGRWRPSIDDAIEQVVWRKEGDRDPDIEILKWKSARFAMTYTALSSWLTRYEVMGHGRIKLWRTATIEESSAFIASRFRWFKKEWKKHQLGTVDKMPLPEKTLLWKANELERVVASHSRIGYKRLRTVTRTFHSIYAFTHASVRELQAAGLGRADALAIYAAIRKEYR